MKRAAIVVFGATWVAMAASHIAGWRIAGQVIAELRDDGERWVDNAEPSQ